MLRNTTFRCNLKIRCTIPSHFTLRWFGLCCDVDDVEALHYNNKHHLAGMTVSHTSVAGPEEKDDTVCVAWRKATVLTTDSSPLYIAVTEVPSKYV